MPGLTLTKEALSPEEINPEGAWFLRVTCTSDEQGLNSKIFVYKAATPGTFYNTGDVFETVASIQQMQDIPEDEPTFAEDYTVPYYRLAVFEAYFTHPDFLNEAWSIIQEDAQLLLAQFRTAESLVDSETVTIP